MATFLVAGAQTASNPFQPPIASVHYAPDHAFDLQHLYVELTVDPVHKTVAGFSRNTMSALRDGTTQIVLNAGNPVTVSAIEVDGHKASYRRVANDLLIDVPATRKGQTFTVVTRYTSNSSSGRSGLHFINPDPKDPNRIGFWTVGEPSANRDWAVTWDYPNDFTTSETVTTVPADWSVVGNGLQTMDRLNPGGKTRTVGWKMTLPHATYLLALVGGPFDIKRDSYRGMPLMYVVPRGKGNLIDNSFADTKDMLATFERLTGVKFPWPKYAQNAMYDFGGGMENVSSTILGEGSLTDGRDGVHTMDSLNSHEMAHQWFGDDVTCRDWGQLWLNESFATFMQMLYTEHSQGPAAYAREVENNTRSYLAESLRYKRPIATNLYSTPGAMFDSHTYPKGGVVLHTMRRLLGDKAFFDGIHLYLERHAHSPVETDQLCRAMTDATGINLHPFFDQWILKPGHPVIEYTWAATADGVNLHILQTQDTTDGTPLYKIPTSVGILHDGKVDRLPVLLDSKQQDVTLGYSGKPEAVILDPDHDFLRDMHHSFSAEEALAVMKYAPNAIDRQAAMAIVLSGSPSDASVQAAVDALSADRDLNPVFTTLSPLSALKRESLKPFFLRELDHPNFAIRGEAFEALAALPGDPSLIARARSLIGDKASYPEVRGALLALAAWDPQNSYDLFVRATSMPSRRESIRTAAYFALGKSGRPEALDLIEKAAQPGQPEEVRGAAIQALRGITGDKARVQALLRSALTEGNPRLMIDALDTIAARKDVELLPDLGSLATTAPGFVRSRIEAVIASLKSGN